MFLNKGDDAKITLSLKEREISVGIS